MEAIKTSSGSNQSQKKTKENESSKTESSELDGFIDPYGLKTETFSEEEMEQTGVNVKRDLDIETQASDDAYTSKRNSTETDISLSDKIGMPGNALITCENPRPVSVIQKTEINKYPVFIVQKLLPTQPLESPIIKLVSSDKEKTLKMSPSSLSRPRTSRKPYARKILPAVLKMETNEMESATMPVREYKEKKLKKAKMNVKRMPLKKKTNSVKNKNVDDQVNADWPNKSTAASSNHSDCETSPDCLNNPEAMSSKDLEFDCPRPVLLVQNKSFARHNTQMSKFKNHQPSINHDNSLLTQNEAALTYDSEFQNIVKSIKTEPEEIQPEMQVSRTCTGRESEEGPTCSQNKKDFERNDNDVNSDAARYCENKQILKSGPTSQMYHSHSKPKSIYSNVTNSINQGHTVSIFSPTNVSTASLKSSINNLPLLASQVTSTACLRNVNIAPNNVGLSLSASQGAARPQTTVTNFLQGTVLATKCQSTTGMKLMTIPPKTITSMAKISGSKQMKSSTPSTTTMVQVPFRPIATTELVSSPLIRLGQPNNLMFPRVPNNSPGLRHPAPFIVPQPDVNVTKAANTESPRILSSVSNQNIIMNQTSTTGVTMSSQSLLISPPSLPQGPGILNNSMFDQSLGGYRLGNIIIKTQNFSSGTLPQTSAVSTTLSPSIASIQGPSAHNQHLIIQGASIQSILSPAPGAIPSSSFQGTTSTGSASSPISSYQLPQTQGVNQNQIQSSPLIHFPVFSQLPGTMVNPGSGQGLFQNATFQTLHQQAPKGDPQLRVQEVKQQIPLVNLNLAKPGAKQQIPQVNLNLAKPGSKQQVSQGNSNLVKPGAKQQIPQVNLNLAKPGSKQQVYQGNSHLVKPGAKQQILPAKANWTLQSAKQQVSPTIQNPLVQRSNPIQSSTTPKMIVIAPNLPNNGTTQIQSTGSSQLSYSQMLKVFGNNSGTSFNQSNIPQVDLGLQTPKLGSSSSTLINLTKPTNLKQTSVSNQPAVLTMGPDISIENVPSSKGLSTSAIDDSPEDVGKISSLTLSNLKKNQPSLQTSELKAQEMTVHCGKPKPVTVSASESSPPSASPMVPTTTTTSLKEVPLKLGSEIKPIPSDIPGPYKAHDHDVLIHVKYKYRRSRNKTRSMYIHDPIWRSMIKGYIRRELNYRHLAKQLFQIPELVKEFHKLFLKQLEAECSVMCSSKTQTILRKVDPPDLENLKFEDVLSELQKDAPLMRSVLEAVRSEKCPDQNLGIIAALLLYSRSTFLSAVHHVITKILHNCGAHTKTIDLLSSLGLCSKSSSYFGNIKRYAARNNSEEFQNTLEDTQQCSDDTMDTGIDASDESVSSDQDFDIKSKLKDKILKKISPAKKLKRKRIKNMSKMKNIQSCSVSKKLKVSHRQKDVKMADSCDTFSVTLNSQGTLSNADRYKTAKSCNESGVPLMSAAKNNNNNNSAMNSFCDNVEIHDGFDQTSDRFK